MPRDGSGQYSYPPGTPGIPDTTIESAKYNGYIADIQQDLNLPRPIVAGGTGATSALQARDNLDAERAGAQVTNYDSHIFENGSFWSAAGASAAPVAGHAFAGIAYMHGDPLYMYVEARDLNDTVVPNRVYVRKKNAGVWGSWMLDGRTTIGDNEGIASETGDMFFGIGGISPSSYFVVNSESDLSGQNLFVVPRNGAAPTFNAPSASVQLFLNKAAALSTVSEVVGMRAGLPRWTLTLGDDVPEGGGNTGSHFKLYRMDDAGAQIDAVLSISRTDGSAAFTKDLIIGSPATSATLYFGSSPANYLTYNSADFIFSGGLVFSIGHATRTGYSGAYSGNNYNFWWSSGLYAYVDDTNIGLITVTSDYRTKRDVKDLTGMWDKVKALRPISYTHADWMPAWELEARTKAAAEKGTAVTPFLVGDSLERWGFVAHELQDTLIPTAATGYKDIAGAIQSPDVMTVVATLTKALQEAMARIEALEAAQAAP